MVQSLKTPHPSVYNYSDQEMLYQKAKMHFRKSLTLQSVKCEYMCDYEEHENCEIHDPLGQGFRF